MITDRLISIYHNAMCADQIRLGLYFVKEINNFISWSFKVINDNFCESLREIETVDKIRNDFFSSIHPSVLALLFLETWKAFNFDSWTFI